MGRDGKAVALAPLLRRFNSRAPHGARPQSHLRGVDGVAFQFTRPAWGATQVCVLGQLFIVVSIHAPRVGRDVAVVIGGPAAQVSIHAPRMGRDVKSPARATRFGFQFTRPAWGATSDARRLQRFHSVSIHAPRMGRDLSDAVPPYRIPVSIHAPRMGRDKSVKRRAWPR